jgi:hypothetical protein
MKLLFIEGIAIRIGDEDAPCGPFAASFRLEFREHVFCCEKHILLVIGKPFMTSRQGGIDFHWQLGFGASHDE